MPRATSPSTSSRRSSKSVPLAADRARSAPRRGRGLHGRQALVELLKPSADLRGGTGGAASPCASGPAAAPAARRRHRSSEPSSCASGRWHSRACVSSNSSLTKWSSPRSPRKRSSVRGRRPSLSPKFWRRTSSRARAARSLPTASGRRATRTRAARHPCHDVAASWSAVSPMRRARSTTAARSGFVALRHGRGEGPVREHEGSTRTLPSTRTAPGRDRPEWGAG